MHSLGSTQGHSTIFELALQLLRDVFLSFKWLESGMHTEGSTLGFPLLSKVSPLDQSLSPPEQVSPKVKSQTGLQPIPIKKKKEKRLNAVCCLNVEFYDFFSLLTSSKLTELCSGPSIVILISLARVNL